MSGLRGESGEHELRVRASFQRSVTLGGSFQVKSVGIDQVLQCVDGNNTLEAVSDVVDVFVRVGSE